MFSFSYDYYGYSDWYGNFEYESKEWYALYADSDKASDDFDASYWQYGYGYYYYYSDGEIIYYESEHDGQDWSGMYPDDDTSYWQYDHNKTEDEEDDLLKDENNQSKQNGK